MLLAIDTCGRQGSVALGRVEASKIVVVGLVAISPKASSAELVPKIRSLLSSSGTTLDDIKAIAVVNGPGSFTGIRVALSTAKGFAQGSGLSLVALSRLRVLADAGGQRNALAVCDAGRGEYYACKYLNGRVLWEKLLNQQEVETEAAAFDDGAFLLEEGARDVFSRRRPQRVPSPDAADALRSALGPVLAGQFADIEALDGNYLRRSGSELFGIADLGSVPAVSGVAR